MNDDLKKYNKKRDFTKTNEPLGELKSSSVKRIFVIQHHLARNDHYDLRLEYKGTLKSWAVPKGPSIDPKDKRLAVRVEDHPYSYKDFEGTIPKGEYGGGVVMLFDEGYWEPLKNTKPDFEKGPIKFILKGKRLKGIWTLVKFKENNWLLIKEKENNNKLVDINKFKTSIRSGRTMEEIKKNLSYKKNFDGKIENVNITNPQKLIFNNPKITKLDIVLYYQKVAQRMLPFIENRLISTIRAPEGMSKDVFFKKHLETKSKGIGKKKIANKNGNKEDYYYIKNINGLISEIQMNSYEIHTWGSKANDINHPDIMVFDLDPDENMSITKVRNGVKDLKSILDDLGLKSYLKTSGGKGFHVVVPIRNIITWTNFRKIAKNIAEIMVTKWPNKYTSNMRMIKRENKIFIDWVRNTKGSTSVAPYSLRLREKAPISMPIFWDELDKIKPNSITLKNVDKRLAMEDPWKDFFE